MNGINITENSVVHAQTPPFQGSVCAGIALFSVATLADCGGEVETNKVMKSD